jgi:ornithine lipid hydroxylase
MRKGNVTELKSALRYLSFPLVLYGNLIAAYYLFFHLNVNLIYTTLIVGISFISIGVLERVIPYRQEWLQSKNDTKTDIIYLVFREAFGQFNKVFLILIIPALLPAVLDKGFIGKYWPDDWNTLFQFILFILIYDFIGYWLHRSYHTIPFLWRFHAVHHSSERLYFNNAPRFHFVELFITGSVTYVFFFGFNIDAKILAMHAVFDSIVGLFQHSNVDIRLGFQNYLYSAAERHRWHHSKLISESNSNYGSNIIIWDILFKTAILPKNRHVGAIGLMNNNYPKSFWKQLFAPFYKTPIDKPADYKGRELFYEQKIVDENKLYDYNK